MENQKVSFLTKKNVEKETSFKIERKKVSFISKRRHR